MSEQKSSPAAKVIAVCGVGIVTLIGYNMLANYKAADCRARAMNITARGIVTVEDVRWGLGGCEMLIRWNNVSGSAEWKSGLTLSILE